MRVPALSPYRRTSRFGLATSPWPIGCSGSSAVFTFGALGSSFQSSLKNSGGYSIRSVLDGFCSGAGGPPRRPRASAGEAGKYRTKIPSSGGGRRILIIVVLVNVAERFQRIRT